MSAPKTNAKTWQLLHDGVKERYNFELERIKRLDDKANYVMGVAGVLVTLMSGLASLSIDIAFGGINVFLLVLSLSLLVMSFYYGLKAYQIRKFSIIPDCPLFVGKCQNMASDKILEALVYQYTFATEDNLRENQNKVGDIKIASNLILIALIIFGIFAIVTIAANGGG